MPKDVPNCSRNTNEQADGDGVYGDDVNPME
jgi:hypothetical protein